MSRRLMIVAGLFLVTVLATHHPLLRDNPPEWYVRICAEVSSC